MITLNKLSQKCLENAYASERVTDQSGPRPWLLQAQRCLHDTFGKTVHRDDRLPQHSEYAVGAAETIAWLVAFMRRIGCEDVEQAIRDAIDYRTMRPDYPPKRMQ